MTAASGRHHAKAILSRMMQHSESQYVFPPRHLQCVLHAWQLLGMLFLAALQPTRPPTKQVSEPGWALTKFRPWKLLESIHTKSFRSTYVAYVAYMLLVGVGSLYSYPTMATMTNVNPTYSSTHNCLNICGLRAHILNVHMTTIEPHFCRFSSSMYFFGGSSGSRAKSLYLLRTDRITPHSCNASRSACDWRSTSSKETSWIKSQAWSNTWQEHQPVLLLAQHHVFHLSLNWLPHICSHKEASELKHGDDSLMDRNKPRKQSGNEPLFCIRSSNFFRCSSSLTSHMHWDMLSHAESVEEKPNTERNSRNGTYGANFRMVRNKLQNNDSWPIRFGYFDARRHLPSVSKQKDRRFKWFHVPMQNLQSCSRKTGVCLQILGMFSALQALEILHSWLGNAQVATPKNVFSHVFCVSYLPEGF